VLKPDGTGRLLEAPRPALRALQRKVLHEVLDRVPPHDAVHGFRRGRSTLTHARLHVGQAVVWRFDLAHFFHAIHPSRALGVFTAAGYPREVARTLLGLCTHRTPRQVLALAPAPAGAAQVARRFALLRRLEDFHLPQGAPTSPALANLVAWHLDVRLNALAAQANLTYSRYADDLTFSGAPSAATQGLATLVARIVRDEGFELNEHKTRRMPASSQQRVTGVVVNATLSPGRWEYDQLKAVLHDCERNGVAVAGRGREQLRGHLAGRIAWVEWLHPLRGARLRRQFDRITWPEDEGAPGVA
jgi:hypothetical protein